MFDNRHEVRISTFDAGAQYDTRPITLWLVVICNERGLPKFGASAEFLGQESLFRPALNHLESPLRSAFSNATAGASDYYNLAFDI